MAIQTGPFFQPKLMDIDIKEFMLRVLMFYLTMFAMGFYAFLSIHAGKQLNSIQIHKILFPVDLYSTYRTIVKRTEIDISFSLPFLINRN